MEDFIKFNNQTAGRDKVFRLVQYCSRIVWYNLEKKGSNFQVAENAKKLDETLGLMRRLLRFGRCVDTFHSVLPVMSSISDQVIRVTSALSRISSACFMLIDHIVCLHKLKLLPSNFLDAGSWDRTSSKFWLYSIVLGIVRDFYDMKKIYAEAREARKRQLGHGRNGRRAGIEAEKESKTLQRLPSSLKNPTVLQLILTMRLFSKFLSQHADLTIDFVKNVCDLCIPLTILGYMKLSPGTTSFLGVISTILSALPQINPMYKMVPAM